MAHHQDSSILSVPIVANILKNGRSAFRIQSGSRFIQNQHIGFHCNHTGDGHTALLPAGEVKRRFFEQFPLEADKARGTVDAAFQFRSGDSLILWTEGNILEAGLLKELILRILEHQSDLAADRMGEFFIFPNIFALKINLSRGRLQKPVQVLDQRGFS